MDLNNLDFTMHGRFLGENILISKVTWDGIDANRYLKPHKQEGIDYLNLKFNMNLDEDGEPNTNTLKISKKEEEKMPYLLFKTVDGQDFNIEVTGPTVMTKANPREYKYNPVNLDVSTDNITWQDSSQHIQTLYSQNGQLYIRGKGNVSPFVKADSYYPYNLKINSQEQNVAEYGPEGIVSVNPNYPDFNEMRFMKFDPPFTEEESDNRYCILTETGQKTSLFCINPETRQIQYRDMYGGVIQTSQYGRILYRPEIKVECYGNIESFVDYEAVAAGKQPTYGIAQFGGLFRYNDCLVKAPTMPSKNLSQFCYYEMFDGCKNLKNAPDLPATVLTESCYERTFRDCSSITKAPKLPATKMVSSCYEAMFSGCSLKKAPELPSTELAYDCYSNMLADCKFEEAPILPANVIPWNAYNGMFARCKNLVKPPILHSKNVDQGAYGYMFSGCSSLKEMPELPATELKDYSYKGMFKDCTSLTEIKTLPATTVGLECYSEMFSGCSSLEEAPELPLTNLTNGCYSFMFKNCKNLKKAPDLNATVLKSSCYEEMFSGCSSLKEMPELPAKEVEYKSYYQMFMNCTSLMAAKELPATTISASCYEGMFKNCSSLESAPEILPATDFGGTALPAGQFCYASMFEYCKKLKNVPELPAKELQKGSYKNMFYECDSITTAPNLPATKLADKCYSAMFSFCDSLIGEIHCPKSTENDKNKLTLNKNSKATVVFDL